MLRFYKFRVKSKILLPIALLSLPFFLSGQSLCKDCKPIPEELRGKLRQDFARKIYEGELFVESLNYKYDGAKNTCWRVYSDRADNPVYSSVTSNTPIGTLNFMDELVVTDFNGTRVYVKKEVSEGGRNICQDFGWVEVANLVLNPYALLNKEGTTKKGLTLINLASKEALLSLKDAVENDKSLKDYTYYFDPGERQKKTQDKEMKIRYVLKEVGDMKLLSVNDKISNLSVKERRMNVSGWINSLYISDWNTRICMEPSYGEIYQQEYPDPVPIFTNPKELAAYQSASRRLASLEGSIYRYPITKERMINTAMRMPVLQYLDNNALQLMAPGKIEGMGSAEETQIKDPVASARKILQDLEEKRENINILFVIDATSSMEDFYPVINSGIKEIITMNNAKYKKQLRFGAAIYRDYADKERAFDISPLSGDVQQVKNFLAGVKCKSVAPASSKHENQYQGFIKAVEKAGFIKEQSNVVILVGDAGNHQPDSKGLSSKMVGKKLVQYNANLIAFQVINGRHPAYSDFNRDARDYINYLAFNSYDSQQLKPTLQKLKSPRNTYELQYTRLKTKRTDLFIEAAFGRFIYADFDQSMPLQTLQVNLTEAMDIYIGAIEDAIQFYKRVIENANNEGDNAKDPIDLESPEVGVLRDKLMEGGLSKRQVEQVLQGIGSFAVKGYTATHFFNSDLACFRQVVFMSSSEVDDIINKLDKFNSDATIAEAKKQLYDVLLEQTKVMLSEQSDDRVLNMTLDEIWQVLLDTPFDVNGEYGTLGDTRLTELTNLPSSKEPYLNDFIAEFSQSISNFNTRNLKQHEFRLYDDVFYWVPIKKIPGNG